MPTIDAGEKAPAFTLPDQSGKAHSLADYAGRPVVLYFYPKDDTSGCTAQACQFRDQMPDFATCGAVVLGVSPDDQASHSAFAKKNSLKFSLLSDVPGPDGIPPVCSDYGVWVERTMYGNKFMGVTRTTYLINAEGRIARRWDNVKVPGHVAEVASALKTLQSGGDLDSEGDAKQSGNMNVARQKGHAGEQHVRGPAGSRGPNIAAKRGTTAQRKP